MPISVKLGVPPRGARPNRKSPIMFLPEWNELMSKLAQGMRPHEYAEIAFTDEQLRQIRNLPRLFRDHAKQHIKNLNLSYDVFMQPSRDGRQSVFVVAR